MTTTYTVNALDQRVAKAGPAVADTTYIYGGQNQLLAERNANGWTSYLWNGNEPVALVRNNQIYYLHTDHLGRPQLATNASRTVVWKANYTPFNRGVNIDSIGGFNFGNPGQYLDAESGLWHNGYRDYDWTTGRYLQSDPIGLEGGINTYNYVGGNPVSRFDFSGLKAGDCYATLDIAAANAIGDINPASVQQDREYGGWLYKTSAGWYSYTAPVKGGQHSVNIGDPVGGALGSYHTHGDVNPGYPGENFSAEDYSNRLPGHTDYLGTPSGRMLKNTGTQTIESATRASPNNGDSCGCAGTNGTFNEIWNNLIR